MPTVNKKYLDLDGLEHYNDKVQAKLDEKADSSSLSNYYTKSQTDANIAVQNGKISTLETRMDGFTHLAEGSTTGDAELIDGRTSFTGRVSANIGGNIRTYQGLNFIDITSTLTKNENKVKNAALNLQDNSSYDCYELSTEKGKIYFIDVNSYSVIPQVVMGYGAANCIPQENSGTHDSPCVVIGTGGKIFVNNLKTYLTPYIGILDTKTSETNGYTDITASLTVHSGKYIGINGTEHADSYSSYYSLTPKKGHKYLVYNAVADGNIPLIYQEDGNIYPDDSGSYTYGTPQLNEYYCVNENTLYINNRITRLAGNVVVLESNNSYSTDPQTFSIKPMVGLFNKAVFIGDSLTYGQTYISDNLPRSYRNNVNYPKTLQKLAQIDNITELARSGATTTIWWEQFNSQITEENAVYFVWLGTNDTFTDTVATDCAGNDYTQYAQTETGDFGRILGKIKSLTGTKIVLLNTWSPATKVTTNNKVINDLATKFDAIVIDLNKAIVKQSGYHTSYNGYYNALHMNNQGYVLIANMVFNQMNDYLNNNVGSYELRSVRD